MEEAKDEGVSKEYVAANRMKHKSLFKLIEKNLIMGEAAKQREKHFFSKLVYEQKITSLINSI